MIEGPGRPRGSWCFGDGTVHRHAFAAVSAANQAGVKDWIVGLGYTDVSNVKDRAYVHSVYLRTSGGALCELAVSTPQGLLIDESKVEPGRHMCIAPHGEDRRAEIAPLEAVDTEEVVV